MNNKRNKIIYWAATGMISVLLLMSAGMYVFNYAEVSEVFIKLGFPVYIIYPLAAAKTLGVIVLWAKNTKALKEWAYAGMFFNFVLASSAHLAINDGEFAPALVAIVLLFVSYIFGKKLA